MRKLKIRTKIMLWFTIFSAVLLGALIPMVYTNVASSLRQTLQANLQMTISQAFTSIEQQDDAVTMDLEELELKDGCYLVLLSATDDVIYASKNAEWLVSKRLTYGADTIREKGKRWAVQVQQLEINEMKITAVAASSMEYVEQSLHSLILLMLFLIPLYLGVSAVGSFLLAKRAMMPISEIIQTAKAIGDGDLSKRISGNLAKDEVGELADTFNGMLDILEVAFKRERQFTSDASHELRTPITVISACTEYALTADGPDIKENLEIIKRETIKMHRIISQLLMLSRGDEGRHNFELDEFFLYDMVDSVSEELKASAEEVTITIHNDIQKALKIRADQSLMTQLFVNLVGNAIKYGNRCGNVWLNGWYQDNSLLIQVMDDGIGISEEDMPHIFERFYRADKARDRSGSGLGLAIAKWIVELHGGTIKVESRVGQATIFTILLPDSNSC